MASYRSFINSRDKALEKILINYQLKLSDIYTEAMINLENNVLSQYSRINDENRFTSRAVEIVSQIESYVALVFENIAHQMAVEVYNLQFTVKMLSTLSETEALARNLEKVIHAKRPTFDKNAISKIQGNIKIILEKYKSKIVQEITRARVGEKSIDELRKGLLKTIPSKKKVVKRHLKPIRNLEADFLKTKKENASFDSIDDDTWHWLVGEYKKEYLPKFRNQKIDNSFVKEDGELYAWEIEQYVTDDFCAQVRDGTIEAAKEAGITDLMWIAVLDERTREEHRLKDGLTSSEIEDKLKDEWSDFEDHAIVAPSGFNCRCRSVPFVKDIDKEMSKYGDFESWLES